MNFATLVAGPLLAPECLRASRKGWLPWVRALAALMAAAPTLAALWWWWINLQVDASEFRATGTVFTSLGLVESLTILLALVLAPAVLAGSLAGEKERGSIGLLLSTRVDAREIVLGRMLGKLSLVGSIMLAATPFLIGLGVLAGFSIPSLMTLLMLPVAVGFGAGGLAVAASSVAKRGRNALLVIYLSQVLILLLPLVGLAPGLRGAGDYLGVLNPFGALGAMFERGSGWPAVPGIATWMVIGLLGISFASWRLRPSYLALVGGKKRGLFRRYRIPPVDESRPMLWKELHIEKVGALGWFGRILGALLVGYLGLGSLLLAALAFWSLKVQANATYFDQIVGLMDTLYGDNGPLFGCLIELAVGLRAAVAVSSERERGTWDALLTSPLSGRDILIGKLWGSIYSLRWLILATFLCWTIAVVFGAMTVFTYVSLMGQTVIISLFMAAVGVRASLANGTATKAMSLTVGLWIGALISIAIVAFLAMLVVMFVCLITWLMGNSIGLTTPGGRPWMPTAYFGHGMIGLMVLCYAALTFFVLIEFRGRFDDLAGRVSGAPHKAPMKPRATDEFDRRVDPAPMRSVQMADSSAS